MLKIVNKKLDWVKANQQNYFLWMALPTIYLFGDQFIQGPPWPWSNWSYGSEIYYAISSYRHWCEFESRSGQGVQHYVSDKVCQWLATGRWFSPGPPVSSTNKTDHHDIAEILLKVELNTIKPNQAKQSIIIHIFENHRSVFNIYSKNDW